MALLDLDKITIKRTIIGIRCTSCGGNLVIAKKPSAQAMVITLISFGTIKPKKHECENCKKKYMLL
jgi:ssDNA-binding Zn-finger/Zn-ribbon topoisomerase 1